MRFLALFVSLPTRQGAGRMRLWRALRSLGCATLRDGVYLLPDVPEHALALGQIAADVHGTQGKAEIYRLDGRDDRQRAGLAALFDRSSDYALIMERLAQANAGEPKAVQSLRRDVKRLLAIDYFPGEAQRQALDALARLEAMAEGEPISARGGIRRLASADFQGRTWATRKNLWVDRLASAWLIRRFIDRKARFLWLDNPKKCPKSVVGFDFDGAPFTHVAGRVSFEVLAASFALDEDPALARIGALVHFLDVGGVPVAEAAGVEAVLAGWRESAADDDKLLAEAGRVFDGLYKNFQLEKAHD
ncbi:MAG: chromate resistance protein [Rhodocyclales bacterium]|nr:chromate resistance protein [Rhodocyclales bacterium]